MYVKNSTNLVSIISPLNYEQLHCMTKQTESNKLNAYDTTLAKLNEQSFIIHRGRCDE